MALLALIIGSFLVSLGVAAVGVVVQDRAEKIASETRAGKWLGWLFLFPVLDQIDKVLTEYVSSGFRKTWSVIGAIAAVALLLGVIWLLIYLLTHHLKSTLLIIGLAAAVLASSSAIRRR